MFHLSSETADTTQGQYVPHSWLQTLGVRVIETRQECGHLLYWRNLGQAPKPGTRIYCQHHDCLDMRMVESRTGTWFARCRDCKWTRAMQGVERLRDRVADHVREKEHAVAVWNHEQSQYVTVRTSHAAVQLVGNDAATRQKSKNGSRIALLQGDDMLF